MQTRRALAILGAMALTAMGAGAAQAAPAIPPTIGGMSNVARYSVSQDLIKVGVDYRCTNRAGQAHFIVLTEKQTGRATYTRGWRGDTGGTRTARCTGQIVHESFTLLRSSYTEPPTPGAKRGAGTLEVGVLPRSTADRGGWYVSTGPDVFKKKQVTVSFVS
jgi:hypothetical protein